MDLGQIMMMQTDPASTAGVTATAEMEAVLAVEKADSIFAGVLRGISPLNSGVPADADTAKTGTKVVPDSSGETRLLKLADANSDIMTAIMAVVGKREQMPLTVATDASEKPLESARPDVLLPQDVALLEAGAQIARQAGENGRMPVPGQIVKPQEKPEKHEKPSDSSQLELLVPQSEVLFTAGMQLAQPAAGSNGSLTESGQNIEQQESAIKLTQRSVRQGGDVAISATSENGLTRVAMATQQGQPVVLSPAEMTTPKADSMLVSDKDVVATKGDKTMTGMNIPVETTPVGVKSGVVAQTEKETPVNQLPFEVKPPLSTITIAAKFVGTSEVSALPADRLKTADPVPADTNILPVEENAPEQPCVRVIKESAAVHTNPAISVQVAGVKQTEGQDDGKPVRLDVATVKKNMESVSVDSAKSSPTPTSEQGLLNEDGKNTSDHGMNNQFQQQVMHQQVKADMGMSPASTTAASQKEPSQPDMSENVVRQVKEVLSNREVKDGKEQVTLRLSPEHLGELTINFKMENQHLKVEIIAANRGVRDAIMQHAENLKEHLSRQNITMESFDVVTSGGQRGFEQNDRGWKQLAQQQFQAGASTGGYRYRIPEVDVPVVPNYGKQSQYAMVDVHY